MKRLVVLTGAGMSAESGISTFRDADGLWENHRIEDVATPNAWIKNPVLVQRFYNERRKQLINAKPNAGHLGLVELEKCFDVQIITQNVDNLHELAGSKNVLHLHGELMKMRSTGPSRKVYNVEIDKIEFTTNDKCAEGYILRPHIVWFGEEVPNIEPAISLIEKADIVLVIGTSLKVYPAAGLLNYAPHSAPVYLIDPNEVYTSNQKVNLIKEKATTGVVSFIKMQTNCSN